MLDINVVINVVLSSLKLADFALEKIKGKLSKKEKKQVVQQAERLIMTATDGDVAKYDTAERTAIRRLEPIAHTYKKRRMAAAKKKRAMRKTGSATKKHATKKHATKKH